MEGVGFILGFEKGRGKEKERKILDLLVRRDDCIGEDLVNFIY